MSIAAIVIAILIGTVLLIVGVRDMNRFKLDNEDAAFTGPVYLANLTPARVAEIESLVDRVSVISIDLGQNRKNPPINADAFDVFIIDVNGAIHDVGRYLGPEQAAQAAYRAAKLLDVPVDDPYDLLPARSSGTA